MRLHKIDQGIIAFVVPNGFLTRATYGGMRVSLSQEFANIYIFDCKGDARKAMEGYKNQRGSLFKGAAVGATMVFFVKNKSAQKQGQIYYYSFERALKQEEKLNEIKRIQNISYILETMVHSEIDQHKS